ncbi:hypothetical protein MHYP_G00047030 [Metynnis hypsauchen]
MVLLFNSEQAEQEASVYIRNGHADPHTAVFWCGTFAAYPIGSLNAMGVVPDGHVDRLQERREKKGKALEYMPAIVLN